VPPLFAGAETYRRSLFLGVGRPPTRPPLIGPRRPFPPVRLRPRLRLSADLDYFLQLCAIRNCGCRRLSLKLVQCAGEASAASRQPQAPPRGASRNTSAPLVAAGHFPIVALRQRFLSCAGRKPPALVAAGCSGGQRLGWPGDPGWRQRSGRGRRRSESWCSSERSAPHHSSPSSLETGSHAALG